MSSEFGQLLEVGLNDLLAHQLLSTDMRVVISQKIVLLGYNYKCSDAVIVENRTVYGKGLFWLSFIRYLFIQLKISQSLIFRMENCSHSFDQILLRWLMLSTQNNYSFFWTCNPLEFPCYINWFWNCLILWMQLSYMVYMLQTECTQDAMKKKSCLLSLD